MCIGTTLAGLTIQRARTNGVRLLTARTRWDKRAARALLAQHGFGGVERDGGEIEYEPVVQPVAAAFDRSAC
jgi:hypothetical protein